MLELSKIGGLIVENEVEVVEKQECDEKETDMPYKVKQLFGLEEY